MAVVAGCAVLLAGWIATMYGAGAVLARSDHHRPRDDRAAAERRQARRRSAGDRRAPLEFGIYPGGMAGTVGASGAAKPEAPLERLAALERLRPPGRPFFVRLYTSYVAIGGQPAAAQLGQQVAGYANAGLDIELVLAYRPRDGGSEADVAGFSEFVRDAVRLLGHDRRLVSVQVTNEANISAAPNAADGYYAGAEDALLRGVVAAKQEVDRDGFRQLRIGFNWAYVTGQEDRQFWAYLGAHGGRRFAGALDWVGFDAYPGTWGPPLRPEGLRAGTEAFIAAAIGRLHTLLLPLARIPRTIALHVSENGYPTGPGRTEAMQSASMEAAIAAVESARRSYDITSYCWFDLRDADSSSPGFQSQYGILRDDYSPKPAFAVYRSLITKLSAP